MGIVFSTTLRAAQAKKVTGIEVPPELVERLGGGKAPLVKATVNGYAFRGKVAVMGGERLLSFSAANREASGIEAGDPIEVTLELDTEERTVAAPDDLRAALEAAGRTEAFERAAPSRRKEWVRGVEEAKTPETRARRIAKVADELL